MLEKTFGLLFFLKQAQNFKKNGYYVYLRITVDGKSTEVSTKRTWEQERWNAQAGKANGTKEDARTLNAYLDVLRNKVHDARKQLLDASQLVTAAAIKNILSGVPRDKKLILDVFEYHNDQMKALINSEFSPATYKRYCTSFKHTQSFIWWKYRVQDIDIKSLDYEFISEYAFWLKSVRKCNHNSTVKYLANFKKIVLKCVHHGWLQRDPFFGFKMAKKEVTKTALSESELKVMANKQFACERLNNVKDIFLFSCYTGLAYIDVSQLTYASIATGIDGNQWIFTKRQKTDTPTRIPLLPQALEIIQKYVDHPVCSTKGCVLPVLSNQKMNAYLKEIADACDIAQNLTFHIARHTFATTITLTNGVPIETVSKMLGHKSLKQTQHYAKILDIKVSDDMEQLRSRLAAKSAPDQDSQTLS